MTTTRLHHIVLLALAAISLGITSAKGQATVIAPGEIIMGFRATGGTGQSANYEIDLGPASTFRDYTTVQNIPLTGVGADLSSLYSASWHSRTDVFWGAVAAVGGSDLNGDVAETLYATKPEVTNGTVATPWIAHGVSGQTSITSVINTAANGYGLASPATNASSIAKSMLITDPNNWSQFQPGGSSSGGISFQNWNPTIEGTPSRYLDLFELPPVSLQQGTFIGRMILNSDGSLTFLPASVVGHSTVQFGAATYSAAETAGVLNVTVTRTGDSTSSATVNLTTSDGATGAANNATAPDDYTTITNQAVTFNAGDTSVIVPVTIFNRAGDQGDRSFTVTLSGPGTGVTIGTQATATATITEASLPSTVNLASTVYSTTQTATTVSIALKRSGGNDAVSVTLTPSNLTGDNAPVGIYSTTPQTVTFAAGSNDATGTITLTPDNSLTRQVQFHVTISSSVSNPTVVAPTSAVVRLLQPDSVAPVLTLDKTTLSLTSIAETASHTVVLTGSAADAKGIIDHVSVVVNGAAPVNSDTLTPTASGATFTATITPVGGLNTIQFQAFDAKLNASTVVTKTFTYVEKRAISVTVSPNSTYGSVSGLKTGVVYQVGTTLTLTAKAASTSYIFDHWDGPGVTGLPAAQLAVLSVPFTDAMAGAIGSIPTFTATFIQNPFSTSVTGNYNGLVVADGASTASNSTNGLVTVALTSAGTFTGTLKIDGFSLAISGLFDTTPTVAVARFGATRSTVLQVQRTTKPAYNLSLNLTLATKQITGTLDQVYRSALVSNSIVTADRAFYSTTNTVPSNYLVNKGQYNVVFPARATQTGLTKADYPQGDGFGSIAVTSAGAITLSGTLADGTKVSASSFLRKPGANATAALYAQLYTGLAGSLGGTVTLDDTQANTDVAGTNFFWFRPWQNKVQYYPWGWPEGIQVDLAGTKLKVVTTGVNAVSAVPNLPGQQDNAVLTFTDGQLGSALTKDVTITPTNVVTNYPTTDSSVKLTVTGSTGLISGTFLHSNGTRPSFTGAILQKGTNDGAFGFFLTVSPKVIDGTGESGSVTLFHK